MDEEQKRWAEGEIRSHIDGISRILNELRDSSPLQSINMAITIEVGGRTAHSRIGVEWVESAPIVQRLEQELIKQDEE